MCASYAQKARKSHFDSFANKILTGIKEIVPDYAEKRAIWELFQNALDIIDGDEGKLTIEITQRGLFFQHNGRPFRDDNLGALIKQYSNGKDYGSNKSQTGQYGTGFLSTHVYGREIILNGAVQVDDLSFRLLKDFKIDRTANNVNQLSDSLMRQDEAIEELCDHGQPLPQQPIFTTSFEYVASDSNKPSIIAMFSYLQSILPYVFCFNDKLSEVLLKDEKGQSIHYKREIPKEENQLLLSKDKSNISLYFIENKTANIKIIFPQNGHHFAEVPKLFLFYPLMETAGNGLNFLIHAQEFRPNRERDFLFLVANNQEVLQDVATNKQLLAQGFQLITEKIKVDETIAFLSVLDIRFIAGEDSFEVQLKEGYIETVKTLKRIEVGAEKKAIGEIIFFDEGLLALPETLQISIYKVFGQFTSLPGFQEYIFLSKIACNWQQGKVEGLQVYTIKDIFKLISSSVQSDYNLISQPADYLEMVRYVQNDVELLNEIALIPNMHHELKTFAQLVRWTEMEPELIKVVDHLCADISSTYLHTDYRFLTNLEAYSRTEFKEDFSKFCNDLGTQIAKNQPELALGVYRLSYLTEYLCYFIGTNLQNVDNNGLYVFFTERFGLLLNPGQINTPSKEVNYVPAFKLLARLYLYKLKEAGAIQIENEVPSLLKLVKLLDGHPNLKDELLDKLACFPSQRHNLKAQSELKIDDVQDATFKDKYFTITGEDAYGLMAIEAFNPYLQHSDKLSGLQLGDGIERKLQPEKSFNPVNPETLPTVLDLIKHISTNPVTWSKWLPNIDKVKEEILLNKFDDEATRNSLFNILSEDEEKINMLGELALVKDLRGLWEAGKKKLAEEYRQKKHLEYIQKVGVLIQDLIQSQLDSELKQTIALVDSKKDEKLQTVEEQNGQDFIIYNGTTPIYYIEVKSRWSSAGIVALSKRQVECCSENPEKYAVVTVNVAEYKSRKKLELGDSSFDELNDNISFDEVVNDIYVNTDLSEEFEQLIKTNRQLEATLESGKLIEFRGHIPQERIKNKGVGFDAFVETLKSILLKTGLPENV